MRIVEGIIIIAVALKTRNAEYGLVKSPSTVFLRTCASMCDSSVFSFLHFIEHVSHKVFFFKHPKVGTSVFNHPPELHLGIHP